MPENDVRVDDVLVAGCPIFDAITLQALICILSGSVEFSVTIFGDPNCMLCKSCALAMDTPRRRNNRLSGQRLDLVSNWCATHSIQNTVIPYLEDSSGISVCVSMPTFLNDRCLRDITHP